MAYKKKLTIDDIAHELGISKTTVSRAISGKGRVSPQTQARVQSHVKERNYRSCAEAQLAARRTHQLALVLPPPSLSLNQPHIYQNMSAIFNEAFARNYTVLVCSSSHDHSDSLIATLQERKVDGVILGCTTENDPLIPILCTQKIPFATMGSLPARHHGTAKVEADYRQSEGCYALSKILISDASGKTALLGNDIHDIANQDRLSGFRRACQECNLPIEQTPIHMGLASEQQITQAVDGLISTGVRRFLCMDSHICMQVVSRLEALGLGIPNDVEIASFCDSQTLSSHHVPITALHFDDAALGQTACRELLCMLHDEPYDPNPRLDYEILLRKSTR